VVAVRLTCDARVAQVAPDLLDDAERLLAIVRRDAVG
jgi:hypothetical protein